jgi:hypothetical protein
VTAAGDQVDDLVAEGEFHLDVGVQDAEVEHRGGNDMAADGLGAGHPQQAPCLLAAVLHVVERALQVTQLGVCPGVQACAPFGQPDAPGGAMQQRAAQGLFQPLDGAADGRRAGPQFSRCDREAAVFDDRGKHPQVGQESVIVVHGERL